ncbi:hypothetical protein LAUMK41_02726 [Mycobacterium attenuatum]|nr:hypothetical protein LAUMK41_02726 [Mycobacterium attenuatum]
MFGRVEQIYRRERPPRVGRDRLQHRFQLPDQRLDTGRVEHIGAEFDRPADPGGRTAAGDAFGQEKSEIHPGRVAFDGYGTGLEVTQGQLRGGVVVSEGEVLPGQYHLDQRMVSPRPGWVEPLHQRLERHVLAVVGGQAALPHLGEQLGEAGIPGHVHPQYQGVDETSHQRVQRGITATCDREADRHIGAGAQPGQQHRQRGLDHHETGGVVVAGHVAYPLLQ